MEHTCSSCGTTVPDGVPFCRNCRAPQIRVTAGEIPPAGGLDDRDELAPSGLPPVPVAYPVAPHAIDWSQGLPAAAVAGLISGLAMAVPLGLFGLGMVAGGFLAVSLYRRRRPLFPITPAMGAKLGAVSGGIGFALFALITTVGMLVFHTGGQLRANIEKSIDEAAARNPGPQTEAMVQHLKSPEGVAFMVALVLLAILVVFLVVSSLGGVVAARLGKNRERF